MVKTAVPQDQTAEDQKAADKGSPAARPRTKSKAKRERGVGG